MANEIILLKTYEMAKFALPILNRFPKNFKFTLGDRLQNHLNDLLETLIEASFLQPSDKKHVLTKANIRIEKLRYLFRLGFELGVFDSGKYREFSVRLDEIGRMIGGWLRSLK